MSPAGFEARMLLRRQGPACGGECVGVAGLSKRDPEVSRSLPSPWSGVFGCYAECTGQGDLLSSPRGESRLRVMYLSWLDRRPLPRHAVRERREVPPGDGFDTGWDERQTLDRAHVERMHAVKRDALGQGPHAWNHMQSLTPITRSYRHTLITYPAVRGVDHHRAIKRVQTCRLDRQHCALSLLQ